MSEPAEDEVRLVRIDKNGIASSQGSKNSPSSGRMHGKVNCDGFDDDTNQHRNQSERRKHSRIYVFACAVFASLNSFLLGYDAGVMSGAIIFIQEDLNITEVQEEVLVGCLSVLCLVGSLVGGRTSDIIGRRRTMTLAAIIFQIGTLFMTYAHSFQVLMIGRLLAGFGVGFGSVIASVYIAEISPSIRRGALTSFPEIFANLGILFGYISNYVFSGLSFHSNWRIMLGVAILPSLLISTAFFVIPESPRWLVQKSRVDEARLVLLKTSDNDSEVEERLVEIQSIARPGAMDEENEEKSVWGELINPPPFLRRMLIVGIGLQCFQQLTGTDAAVYYSPEIFKEAGAQGNSKLLGATVAVGVMKTAFVLVATLLLDKLGRKPLLYISTAGMTVCLFVLGVALSLPKEGEAGVALAILAVCGSVAFFSVGMGPICWVLTSEIFPLRYRALAVSLGAAGNRICSGLVAMSFLSVSRTITAAGTFFAFSAISALSIVFVHMLVPETKGKSLEQIGLLFQKDGSTQKLHETHRQPLARSDS